MGGGGVGQRKQKSVEGATIGEAKAITRCITRTSTKHAGRPADYYVEYKLYNIKCIYYVIIFHIYI